MDEGLDKATTEMMAEKGAGTADSGVPTHGRPEEALEPTPAELRWKRIIWFLHGITDVLILGWIMHFLLLIFKPSLILADTYTTGGDMGSHMYSAQYMLEYLLPNLKMSGWSMDWYAGIPVFEFYFPLPFAAIGLLSHLIGFNVAYKLVTVSGVFLLPICTYASMRLMRFEHPMPAIAAAFSLNMLFNEEYSMWGGNIKSTLAGEFTFTIGVALTVLFLGLIYSYVTRGKNLAASCLVLASIPLCHVYTLIWGVLASFYMLFAASFHFLLNGKRESLIKKFNRAWTIYILGFLLSAFWSIRLISKFEWATPFGAWRSQSLWEVVPAILLPYYLLGMLALVIFLFRPKPNLGYLIFQTAVPILIFAVISMGITEHLLDVRFMPFAYLGLLFMSAEAVATFLRKIKGGSICAIIVVLLAMMWVNNNQFIMNTGKDIVAGKGDGSWPARALYNRLLEFKYEGDVPGWVKWNYEGYERKSPWRGLEEFFNYLDGLPKGRVVHEFSPSHGAFGTPRTLELIPFFSRQPVLEGLNIESGVSSPFHFYMQSEFTASPTCPLSYMRCTRFDLPAAKKHFRYFAPAYIVVSSDKLRQAIEAEGGFTHLKGFQNNMDIYSVDDASPIVEVPDFMPVMVETSDWRKTSMRWWKDIDAIDVPLVLMKHQKDPEKPFTKLIREGEFDPKALPRESIAGGCEVKYTIYNERVEAKTNCPGKPHLIKISYNPSWKVEGAPRIWLAAPSFMMVVPEGSEFTIYYGTTIIEKLALGMSWAGVFILLLAMVLRRENIAALLGDSIPGKRIDEANAWLLRVENIALDRIVAVLAQWPKALAISLIITIILGGAWHISSKMDDCNHVCMDGGYKAGSAVFPYLSSGSDHFDMGYAHGGENIRRGFICTATCDKSRGDFVYVSRGNVSFDMRAVPGMTHKLTLRVDDNYWCRTMDIAVNGRHLATLERGEDNVGWGGRTFIVPAELIKADKVRLEFSHDRMECLGFDVSDVWFEVIQCECS